MPMKSSAIQRTPMDREDLRVRRTHKLLWDALMAEMTERRFEEISVKDVCERAMVHRTTFYKHYDDKYVLLERGMRQMYEALLAGEEHVPPSAFTADQPPPYVIRLFEHVAQHRQFYWTMLCGDGVGRFQKLIKDYIAELASTQPLVHIGNTPATAHRAGAAEMHATGPSVERVMHLRFFAGGVLSLLAWWLESDMPLSPYQMAQYVTETHGTAGTPTHT